jgi:cytochrome c peroxidase
MRNAIAAFERTLLTPGKFDKFLGGDLTALNEQELRGCKAFIETGCTACHMGPLLGGNMFQKYPLFGTHVELTGSAVDDLGKMAATKTEADKYFFKVPSLRNIAETWPYLHDGSVKELDKTVQIMAKGQLSKELSPEQISDIAAFMTALTGEVPAEAKVVPVMP